MNVFNPTPQSDYWLIAPTQGGTGARDSPLPERIITPLPEVSFCPSLYQLSLGGGMALLSQDKVIGWLRTTSTFSTISSLSSPSCPRPQAASLLFTRWKTGGTTITGARFSQASFSFTVCLFFSRTLPDKWLVDKCDSGETTHLEQ